MGFAARPWKRLGLPYWCLAVEQGFYNGALTALRTVGQHLSRCFLLQSCSSQLELQTPKASFSMVIRVLLWSDSAPLPLFLKPLCRVSSWCAWWVEMHSQMVRRSSFYLRMPNLVTCHGVADLELCICFHLLLRYFTEVVSVFSRLLVLLLLCQCRGKARTCMRPSAMVSEKTLVVAFCCSKIPENQSSSGPPMSISIGGWLLSTCMEETVV